MSETAVVTTEQADLSLSQWHSRQDIAAYGRRIKTMLPSGDKLSDLNAMALAQYSLAMGLNPFRGEVYGYVDRRGQFVMVDGYKALVRWAHWRMPYTHSFEDMAGDPELPENAIGARCYILRQDNRAMLLDLIKAGATFPEAKALTTTWAVGIVQDTEQVTRDGRPIPPPSGWTWEQVARKRALKNALNQSHGMPSPVEIQQSMEHEEWTATAGNVEMASERDQALPAERTVRGLFKTEPTGRAQMAQPTAPAEAVWFDDPGELEEPVDEVEEHAGTDDGDELLKFFGLKDIPAWVLELRRQAEQAPGASDPITAKSAVGLIANLARKLGDDKDRARRFVRWVWCCEPEEMTKAMFNVTGKMNGELAERVAELEAIAAG